MHPLLIPFYRAVAGLAATAAHVVAPGQGKATRAIAARREATAHLLRWARASRDRTRPLLWMHAPSVGEGLQARPVLERLRAQRPDVQLLYTFFSPSAESFARGLPVDVTGYLPFDTVGAATALLDALAPTALVFAKLDVWPQLVEQAAARGVRTGIISATLPDGGGRTGWVARALLRDAYASLDAVGAIDADDAARLITLGVHSDRITVAGDTRYDQVAARAADTARAAALRDAVQAGRPTLVAGSTWPSDEQVLFAAWPALRAAMPTARLLIAPHEPTPAHLATIEQRAAQLGASVARLATIEAGTATANVDVVLIDRVGVLGDLYGVGTAAFVGGGFHAAGLHSVLEPAAFGVPVLFGPGGDRVRDARLLVQHGGGRRVHDTASLATTLVEWFTMPAVRDAAGEKARAVVMQGCGAADRATALVAALLG